MDFSKRSFKEKINIDKDLENCDIVFVSDMFVDDYVGGAELTSEALIESSPVNVYKMHSKNINLEILKFAHKKFWIFSNFSSMDLNLVPTIIANLDYSVIEYDYKFCKYRSPEKHKFIENKDCNCHNEDHGKLISAFFLGARSLWWMSENQRDLYHKHFPVLENKLESTVLSSVFNDQTFAYIKTLNENNKDFDRKGWLVLGSKSWIKGCEQAEEWCKENNKQYEIVWNLPYHQVLQKLSKSEGFVYLPNGSDTCPRMVIEAKLLGCKLELNEFVQHKDEIWFNTNDFDDTYAYLYMARSRFWNGIKSDANYQPEISGYTTTLNCIENNYPFMASIDSMLGFCSEVVIVDGGSSDGTWEQLQEIADKNNKIKVHRQERDWSSKRFAVFDGMQKALARSLCTKQFCWQMDADEVVHENDYEKIKGLVRNLPKNIDLLALPVIEYWGGNEKVRLDVNPWKWRLSRNIPHITHGIPNNLRKFDSDGNLYSSHGSDGCDYIRNDNYEPVQFSTFYTQDVHNTRLSALQGDQSHLKVYEEWFNSAIDQIPSVFHFSWWNIHRKILTYKNYWSKHWESLYNDVIEDTAENNMFFDLPWSKVTDKMITDKAKELKENTGGWVFHKKWDGSCVNHLNCTKGLPEVIKNWVK